MKGTRAAYEYGSGGTGMFWADAALVLKIATRATAAQDDTVDFMFFLPACPPSRDNRYIAVVSSLTTENKS